MKRVTNFGWMEYLVPALPDITEIISHDGVSWFYNWHDWREYHMRMLKTEGSHAVAAAGPAPLLHLATNFQADLIMSQQLRVGAAPDETSLKLGAPWRGRWILCDTIDTQAFLDHYLGDKAPRVKSEAAGVALFATSISDATASGDDALAAWLTDAFTTLKLATEGHERTINKGRLVKAHWRLASALLPVWESIVDEDEAARDAA
jgi:hypothetical protein